MEFLKNVFGDKALTFDDFKSALESEKSIKLANLADGKYVDKDKLDKKIEELNTETILLSSYRATLATLKKTEMKNTEIIMRKCKSTEIEITIAI